MIDEIYVNGDSFSALDRSGHELKVYSQQLQELTGITTVNHAVPGSSNDRIIRTTLEHCAHAYQAQKRLMVIINLSYFTREELWWTYDSVGEIHRPQDYKYFDSQQPSRFITMDAVMNQARVPESVKTSALMIDEVRQLVHTLTKIFMLVHTLRSWNMDYILFSGPGQQHFQKVRQTTRDENTTKDYLDRSLIWSTLCSDSNIFNLEYWSLVYWGQIADPDNKGSHLAAKGHRLFAEFLLDKINPVSR